MNIVPYEKLSFSRENNRGKDRDVDESEEKVTDFKI